jgi:hypothetical protein
LLAGPVMTVVMLKIYMFNLLKSEQKCCGIFKQGNRTPRLFRKQYLLACQQQLSRFTSKAWAPRTKGPYLIYPSEQVTEARSKV